MDQSRQFERPNTQRAWIGVGIQMFTLLGTAVVIRQTEVRESGAIAAVALMALGILAIGAINVRRTPYPQWAYVSMVAIMIAAVLATPMTAASPESWAKQTRDSLWMFPWFLILLSFQSPSKQGICAAGSPRVGWLMVGTSALLGLAVQFLTWLRV